VVPGSVTRLVRRVGTNGEIHETPILTTYHRKRNQEEFEVLSDDEFMSFFFFILFFQQGLLTACPVLAKTQPVTTPVAANERVRKSPPRTTSKETTVTIKRPKTDTAGSRGRTRISDFDDLTKSLADEAISIYQAQIVAVQPWPSTTENWQTIGQAWLEVCASRKVRLELDDEIFKVVSTSLLFSIIFHW
jgi:hypothetical protein